MIKLQKQVHPVLQKLFDFFCNSNLNRFSSTKDFIDKVEEFLDKYPEVKTTDKDLILSGSFHDFDLYEFDESFSSRERIMFIINLGSFHSMIKDKIEERSIPSEPFIWTGLKRQVSPPYSAYKYTGHTNMDIDFSKVSNYCLFDK